MKTKTVAKLFSKKKFFLGVFILLLLGFVFPENFKMPVLGANKGDYNQKSFWFYPWGKSITHKGVDVFAKNGTPLNSATNGLVIYAGEISMGGKVVLVLGPKWRLHYYAHLDEIETQALSFVGSSTQIGSVGSSGNAAGKAPHLHYSIMTPLPHFWKMDNDHQGWRKMFYVDPTPLLNKCLE